MRKFILIDHSLKDLGGHYYTYASCVLPAAQRAGFAVALAVNREFRDFDALPKDWTAHAVYRDKSHSHRTLQEQRCTGTLGALTAWWTQMRKAMRTRERERIARSFAEDCTTLFECVPLNAGDHVFIATASELDLDGLTRFLQAQPRSGAHYRDVDWHLQFHLGPFNGRDPDYKTQTAARESMHEVFAEALARAPGHRIHLYCTTEQLTAQYQSLRAAQFDTLPYPVHPLFREGALSSSTPGPVRIACLGHTRREKGYRQLPAIVTALWPEYLRAGRAQLVMQTRRRDLQRRLDALFARLGDRHHDSTVVSYASFPLSLERYAALVRSSGIGLLLYDSARYYARCSGVLLEMLTAGVPVIVPAGCWLSEQIEEETQSHLDTVAARAQVLHGSCARSATVGELDVPANSTSLLVSYRRLAPQAAGTYVRLHLEQLDTHGHLLDEFASITGPRAPDRKIRTLFNLSGEASRVRLSWHNAWDDATLHVGDIEFQFLGGDTWPLGAVGLSFAEVEHTPRLLLDMLQHMEHYRRMASEFAERLAREHNADQIVAQLTADRSLKLTVNQ